MAQSQKVKRPLNEVLPVAQDLMEKLRGSCDRIEVAGSLRRQCQEVGDIEIVAVPKIGVLHREVELDIFGNETVNEVRGSLLWVCLDAMLHFTQAGCGYTKRGEKYRQFVWNGVQVDFFSATVDTFGWIYLIRTGSAEFSHHVAGMLNRRGYESSGGQIRKKASPDLGIVTPEERDVFRLAGMAWVEPEDRI